MKKIENGNFRHTLLSALSCVLLMALAGVLVSICSLDSLVFFKIIFFTNMKTLSYLMLNSSVKITFVALISFRKNGICYFAVSLIYSISYYKTDIT